MSRADWAAAGRLARSDQREEVAGLRRRKRRDRAGGDGRSVGRSVGLAVQRGGGEAGWSVGVVGTGLERRCVSNQAKSQTILAALGVCRVGSISNVVLG